MAISSDELIRGAARFLGPVIAAVLVSLGATATQTEGKADDSEFRRVAISNCEAINDLLGTLRELVLSAPDDNGNDPDSEAFVGRALSLLEPRNCNELVTP